MKISANWLRQFIDFTHSPAELAALLTGCGLEVEQISAWQSLAGGLKGLVTGEVLTCVRHPNADRLHVTTVNTGDGEIRQIVCGAPNVAAGQKVIVALPGAMMYPFSGEPFEIKKSKIRGEVSDGMICAEDEIGIGESHAGILLLPEDTRPGIPAADWFKLEEDTIIEIGLTPNRADAASHYGVARDLKAVLGLKHLNLPDMNPVTTGQEEPPVKVIVHDHDACPRYSGLSIRNVKVAESPEWLKNRLKSTGIRSVNNVVDITNYVMFELGQPLHAFDAVKIHNRTIHVKTMKAESVFETLDGIERKLAGHELMIADDEKGLCIAGVFGGIDSGVNAATTEIFLESAYFNPVRVRKAARQHGLHTDSSFRFERGTDPEMTLKALYRAANLIQEIAGGEFPAAAIDIYPHKIEKSVVNISFRYLQSITGAEIPVTDIRRILNDLEIEIVSDNGSEMELHVPAYRTDVTRPADIAEEILRIYGYNNIPLPAKLSFSQAPLSKPDPWQLENRIGTFLSARGFNEILANSLVSKRSTETLPLEGGDAVDVLNPLSSDLDILRHHMLVTGLQTIAYNLNRQQKNLRLFENGYTYVKYGRRYEETKFLSLYLTGLKQEKSWNTPSAAYDFFELKSVLQDLLLHAGVNLQQLKMQDEDSGEGQFYSLSVGKRKIAHFGKPSAKVLKQFDIMQDVWYAEIRPDVILSLPEQGMMTIPPPPKFPEVKRDLSMVLDQQVRYQEIEKIAFATVPGILKEVSLFDVYEGDKIEQGKKSYAVSFLLRDEEQTLQDQQIDMAMEKLMKQFEEKLGAVIRKA